MSNGDETRGWDPLDRKLKDAAAQFRGGDPKERYELAVDLADLLLRLAEDEKRRTKSPPAKPGGLNAAGPNSP